MLLMFVLSALLASSLSARDNTAWSEDVWLADNGVHPCTVRPSRCDMFLRRIYDGIIDARQRGDADALGKWRRRLRLHYISNPEEREDVWLPDNGLNPCTLRRPHCDIFLRRIYDRIIDARQRADADALEEGRRQLYWYYMSNSEQRPGAD